MNTDVKLPTDSELARLDSIESRMDALDAALKGNTAATLEGNRDVRELLEIFQAVRGGFKVLGWLGTAAKWIAAVVGAAGALWAVWHNATGGSGKP